MGNKKKLNIINNHNNLIRRMSKLYKKLELLFENYSNNDISNPINIKYKFCEEHENGLIEYKRNLITYNKKRDKLLRQIYWRLHESITHEPLLNDYILNENIVRKNIFENTFNNVNFDDNYTLKCYYIIGLEDDGKTGKQTLQNLYESLNIIYETISNTNIKLIYLYLINEIDKSNLLVVKFELQHHENNYFE